MDLNSGGHLSSIVSSLILVGFTIEGEIEKSPEVGIGESVCREDAMGMVSGTLWGQTRRYKSGGVTHPYCSQRNE